MKKQLLFLISISAMLLTSCSAFGYYKNHVEKVNVYEIDRLKDSQNKRVEDCLSASIDARFIDGEKYIPYLTLSDYASLYSSHFFSNAVSEVKSEGGTVSWKITIEDTLYFYAAIAPISKLIVVAGDIQNAFKEDDNPRDLAALNYGVKHDGDNYFLGNQSVASYSFKNTAIKYIKEGDDYYFPLGLLDMTFSDSSGIYFTYNYKHIYATRDVENYSGMVFTEGEIPTSVDRQMSEMASDRNMPSYLIEYNADLFMFLMQNFYGLKNIKGISSMEKYYVRNGIYKNLYSSDPSERSRAYCLALNILDDNHTTLLSVNNTWNEKAGVAGYGAGVVCRSTLRTALREKRKDYYENVLHREEQAGGDILYSDSGKTAMFHFESFSFGTSEQVFADEQKTIKQDAYLYDAYFSFIRNFNLLKEKGGVENVVIDISTNGGGTVGVMMKLLALVSKNNDGVTTLYDESTMIASVYHSSVDVNNDGKYDADDVFGDDFNIYLLTSDCSFSCANAFPCMAKQLGVKIIGERSGGGECAVAIHYLPNSQYVYHSSTLHLGLFDEKNKAFIGIEDGAEVDYVTNNGRPMCSLNAYNEATCSIPDDFFNINSLENMISSPSANA